MNYLENFLECLETYYNPSNQGRWTTALCSLLNELVASFATRIKKFVDNLKFGVFWEKY